MSINKAVSDLQFLSKCGETAQYILEKDWSKSPLGAPGNWPQNLRITLSIILNSSFPMLLLWNSDLICFYNDAYRPILEAKGIRNIIGNPARKLPEEIRNIIIPKANHVLTNAQSVLSEEMLLPILHNGKTEVINCSLSYTPIFNESGKADGVFVSIFEKNKKTELNEEKFNIVIDASELGIWELNLITHEASYSPKYFEIISGSTEHRQLTHEQLIGYLHPEDLEIRNKALKNALANGILDYEARLIWDDKSIHWMEGKGRVFYNENKEPVKMVGTIRDITKEREAQMMLIKNEQKFRLLSDTMPQHIWTSDVNGNLTYYNQSFINYSGMSLKEIYENDWLDIIHPDDREENRKKWKESITTGKEFRLEHRLRRHDGIYRWHLSRAVPQRDADKNIQMWVGSSTEIQDQKEFTTELENKVQERTKELKLMNQYLEQSEQRYHLMVEEIQDYAIIYLNRDGIVENWNKGAEKIKGYTAKEIVGKNFTTFYTDEDRINGLPQKLLAKAAKDGRSGHEGWRVKKDGTLFWASVAITALHNNSKEVIGFSKVTHDLSFQKEADDKIRQNAAMLEQKNMELEKMNKELQSFAYISSHDLQEPLRKIQTFSDQISEREAANLSENGKDKFKRMQNAANRMQNLINDLLAYSRTNDQEIKLIKTDLSEIINNIREDLTEELQQKEATIESSNLKCDVYIVPFQFHQLLFNLVSNSLKFSREGVPPIIKIDYKILKGKELAKKSLLPETDYCHIIFSDNGIGFEQQYNEKIFEVFQRLHGKEIYQGTGIGLAIVKKIIENHKGIISAKGAVGKGATFEIIFPVKSTDRN